MTDLTVGMKFIKPPNNDVLVIDEIHGNEIWLTVLEQKSWHHVPERQLMFRSMVNTWRKAD